MSRICVQCHGLPISSICFASGRQRSPAKGLNRRRPMSRAARFCCEYNANLRQVYECVLTELQGELSNQQLPTRYVLCLSQSLSRHGSGRAAFGHKDVVEKPAHINTYIPEPISQPTASAGWVSQTSSTVSKCMLIGPPRSSHDHRDYHSHSHSNSCGTHSFQQGMPCPGRAQEIAPSMARAGTLCRRRDSRHVFALCFSMYCPFLRFSCLSEFES
jgi:hypothetical protein